MNTKNVVDVQNITNENKKNLNDFCICIGHIIHEYMDSESFVWRGFQTIS